MSSQRAFNVTILSQYVITRASLSLYSSNHAYLVIMQRLNEIVSNFANVAWGLPLVILLIGGGLYLLILSRFTAFRYLYHALELLRGKHKEENAEGEITHFQALSTALSSTIGMGNIAGVAVAISIGGPGAIFWMWVSGIIGMSTKFFTG